MVIKEPPTITDRQILNDVELLADYWNYSINETIEWVMREGLGSLIEGAGRVFWKVEDE